MAATGFIAARSANLIPCVGERYSWTEILSKVNPSLWKAYPTVASIADRPCFSSAARMNFPVSSDPQSMVSVSQTFSPRKILGPGDAPTNGTFCGPAGAGGSSTTGAASSASVSASAVTSSTASSDMRKTLFLKLVVVGAKAEALAARARSDKANFIVFFFVMLYEGEHVICVLLLL